MSEEQQATIQQEELTANTLPPPIDEQPHEFTEPPLQPEADGIDINLSELLPAMVAGIFFSEGGKKADGTELTNEDRAAAFAQQSTLILKIIGFDDAIGDVMPGVADAVNPLYVVGGGLAAMMGIAVMMRPPKKSKQTPKQPQKKQTANMDDEPSP